MKHSQKCTKTSDGNKHHNSRATPEKPVSTSNMSTSQERIDIRIPKSSKIYQYLYVDTGGDTRAKWERLDSLLAIADISYETHTLKIWADFIARIGALYPEKVEKLKSLQALIIWHILWDDDLPTAYWQKLMEL